ncbi:MAG: TraR/DksA C4-type zinc finger protein [Gemmatimonadaceae bacterium]
MHKQLERFGFPKAQLAEIRTELERERVRVKRSLVDDETTVEYEAILSALQRIDDDDDEFGRCSVCGAHITFGRLSVLPATEYCMTCSR